MGLLGFSGKQGEDWFSSNAYGELEISEIKDPQGGNQVILPTAIPSPFARIDLVKTAFANMVRDPNCRLKRYAPDNRTIVGKNDEKLVSDTLDIAQILFDYDNYSANLRIIPWNPTQEINELKNSGNPSHVSFAEALELYFNRDSSTYNFDHVRQFYLIEYEYNLIGCTSPCTLFFPTGNDIDVRIQLHGNDVALDDHYRTLYERDEEFQKFLYALFEFYPHLQTKMNFMYEYLNANLRILQTYNGGLYSEIQHLRNGNNIYEEIYEDLSIEGGNKVEVLGCFLKKRKNQNIIEIIKRSDFAIKSNKYKGELKPLVLQNGLMNGQGQPWHYTTELWPDNLSVPYKNPESNIEQRILPGSVQKYPYITVSDFLEPYLIRLIYPINKEKYFDGNLIFSSGDKKTGYLLPLKKEFFNFFNTEDLVGSNTSSPKITMEELIGDAVRVKLEIPVQRTNSFIKFERTYYKRNSDIEIPKPNEDDNEGCVIEHRFGVSIFPFIKTQFKPFHRIQLIDVDTFGVMSNSEYRLQFYANEGNSEMTSGQEVVVRQVKGAGRHGKKYYALENSFDYYRVSVDNSSGASGIVVPKWPMLNNGTSTFHFAIDFGTTNTHIEYSVDNNAPKAFDINNADIQTIPLFDLGLSDSDFLKADVDAIELVDDIDLEFVPIQIGATEFVNFPQRTAITDSRNINLNRRNLALADFNIPFVYMKKPMPNLFYNVTANLKWGENIPGIDQKIEAYFEQLIMMIRNKVLLNSGDLSKTKITWFFPTSMKPTIQDRMGNIWNKFMSTYFGTDINPSLKIAESLAPFYYYRRMGEVMGNYRPVVSIDIGGGTTDVVVFREDKPVYITSFKFAGNSIFGDYNDTMAGSTRGMHLKYIKHFTDLLTNNNLQPLVSLLEQDKSEEINAFLFSLENNRKVDSNLFSYNRKLHEDNDLKIIFLYFYSAIIYHVAQMLKKNSPEELPQKILFSGTGSKILKIIDLNPNSSNLKKLSKLIIEKVFGKNYSEIDYDLEIIQTNLQQKEITCKGGIYANDLSELELNKLIKNHHYVKGLEDLRSNDLKNDVLLNELINHIKEYNSFFVELNLEMNFDDYFGVSQEAYHLFKELINKELREYLQGAIQTMNYADDVKINETLFFYPITGTISRLSHDLAQLNPLV